MKIEEVKCWDIRAMLRH